MHLSPTDFDGGTRIEGLEQHHYGVLGKHLQIEADAIDCSHSSGGRARKILIHELSFFVGTSSQ